MAMRPEERAFAGPEHRDLEAGPPRPAIVPSKLPSLTINKNLKR
jgi:hypothetical protein